MNAKLKPCPKCGGINIAIEDVVTGTSFGFVGLPAEVCCDATKGGCGHYVEAENLNDAIDKWNAQEERK